MVGSHDPDRADGPPVPRSPRRSTASTPDCPSSATRTTSSTSARRSAGCAWAATERHPAPWSLDGIPPDFNGKLLAPDWPRFEEIMAGASAGSRRSPTRRLADDQRPRGLHARQRVHPAARATSAGSSSRPGSAPTASPGAGGIGRQVASWIVDWRAGARPVAHGHPAVRRPALAVARVDAGPDDRGLLDLLRHPLPQRGAPGRPAAADVADIRATEGAGRGLRREERLGAAQLVRAERGRRALGRSSGPRGPATERLGGRALVAGDRGRGARDPSGGCDLRRDELRQDRGDRRRCGGVPGAAVRERGRRPGRACRLHLDAELARRHRDRPDRDPRSRPTATSW
jgi:hypothetical protein